MDFFSTLSLNRHKSKRSDTDSAISQHPFAVPDLDPDPSIREGKHALKTYRTCVRFTSGLYSFFIYPTVDISLKFGTTTLMLCGLYSREVCGRERVNLTDVWYSK